ncbi:hypothetical protein SK128_023118 [Halocaridina rubra]|uniref:Peptidase S1 domain-containing protein n=1 Tax=Halocaridina rubra TaxID=373956 RepID=A0AAN8XAW6_HALRR
MKVFCRENNIGFIDRWDHFTSRKHMYARDGVHLSNSGVSVLAGMIDREIIRHPSYNGFTMNNDIALLKLDSAIEFPADNKVAPICLPSAGELYTNVEAVVTGWGTLASGGFQPFKLNEVTVPTMTNTQCQTYYGASSITSNMLCAGVAAGGKDSCQVGMGKELVLILQEWLQVERTLARPKDKALYNLQRDLFIH